MQPGRGRRRGAVDDARGAPAHPPRARGVLAATRSAAQELARALEDTEVAVVLEPDLDILCPFPRLARASQISARCEQAFASLAAAGWHVAKLRLNTEWLRQRHPWIECDAATVTSLRMVLMKPAHADIVDELAAVVREHLGRP